MPQTALVALDFLTLHVRTATYSLSFPYFLAQTPCLCDDTTDFAAPRPRTRAHELHYPAVLTHADPLAIPQILPVAQAPHRAYFAPGRGSKRMLYTNCRTMQLAAWSVFVKPSLAGKPKICESAPLEEQLTLDFMTGDCFPHYSAWYREIL